MERPFPGRSTTSTAGPCKSLLRAMRVSSRPLHGICGGDWPKLQNIFREATGQCDVVLVSGEATGTPSSCLVVAWTFLLPLLKDMWDMRGISGPDPASVRHQHATLGTNCGGTLVVEKVDLDIPTWKENVSLKKAWRLMEEAFADYRPAAEEIPICSWRR